MKKDRRSLYRIKICGNEFISDTSLRQFQYIIIALELRIKDAHRGECGYSGKTFVHIT